MSFKAHIRIFVFASLVWIGFWLAGLPAYYQQYSQSAMIWFDALLLLPIGGLFFFLLRKIPPSKRLRVSLWYGFYFTVPFLVYDWLYCGVHLGHGLGFLSTFWYLTVYYAVPWIGLPLIAIVLGLERSKQSGRHA